MKQHALVLREQQRERGEPRLHTLRRDETAHVEEDGVVLPVDLLKLLFEIGVGRLVVVLDARERRTHGGGVGRGSDRIEHRGQLLGATAARHAVQRDVEAPHLLAPALARNGGELPGVDAEWQRREALVESRYGANGYPHALAHLVAVHEHAAGGTEGRARHTQEALVLLDRVFQLAAVRHHGVWHAGGQLHAARHFGDQRGVVGVQRLEPVAAHEVDHDVDVAVDVGLERVVGHRDHRHGIRELLVPVPHEHGQSLAEQRLVHDATAGVRDLARHHLLHAAIVVMTVRLGDAIVPFRVRLLADEVDRVPVAAERLHDGARPEVAARTFEQIAVQ
jgi:hypothetical protein